MANTGKLFGRIFSCLLFATALIIREDLFEGIIIGKYLYFITVCSVLILYLGLYLLFSKNTFPLSIDYLSIYLGIFLLYLMFHCYFKQTIIDSKLISTLLLILLSIITLQYFKNFNNFELKRYLILSFLAFGIFQSYLGINHLVATNFILNDFGGTLGNSGLYSIFLSTYLVFGLENIFVNIKSIKQDKPLLVFIIVTIVLSGFVLYFSNSRTSLLMILTSLFFLLINNFNWKFKVKVLFKGVFKKILIGIVSISVIILLFANLYSYKENSAIGRIVIWKSSIEMVKKNPLFGKGHNQFSEKYDLYQAIYFSKVRPQKEIFVAGKVKYTFNDFY